MRKISDAQINDSFEGWDGESVYELTDGTKWRQARYFYSYSYSYMPRAKVYEKDGTVWMDVDGRDPVEVVRVW